MFADLITAGSRVEEQADLFYEFSLETHVPTDHRLRSIDGFVELGAVRRELASFYSTWDGHLLIAAAK